MNKKFICTFDYGNTKEKGALFQNNEIETEFVLKEFSDIVQKYNLNIKNCQIVECSVKSHQRLKTNIPSFNVKDYFKSGKFLEMKVNYSETLGMDRLVQAFFLHSTTKGSKVIIDTGTFTTIDFVNDDGFVGGYILPGFEVLRKTYQSGDLLKGHNHMEFIDLEKIPTKTQDAINNGLHLSFMTPIIHLLTLHDVDTIYITGGNAQYIDESFKENALLKDKKLVIKDQLIHESLKYISERVSLS